ncbi:MAG: glycosyltransferase family 92 protein [Eubacteriales bacterium]|nr:glycosyltransferase family 92 protein [Eubacteriales bacterium]
MQAASDSPYIDLFLQNNLSSLNKLRRSGKTSILFRLHPRLRQSYAEYLTVSNAAAAAEQQNLAIAGILNTFENMKFRRAAVWLSCAVQDFRVMIRQNGTGKVLDYSDRRKKDYYAVAVIVKNEARYIREFILFYQATGADRIYVYDNDSTDNLLEEIEPFLKDGFVIYRKWSGRVVQTAAYRDAVRRTKHNTRWLALIDADEFLFSPKGRMPEQLKAYEDFPGIGVNWVMYGPNGHVKRPEGLVMDNYTTTQANSDALINCHIKSIVQPRKVFCINRIHFVLDKGGKFAVNEQGWIIDNYCSVIPGNGKAFTARNHRTVFRINHYNTKSLEDLKAKCARGFPDGAPNANYDNLLLQFAEPLTEDYSIKPYADLIRERCRQRSSRTSERPVRAAEY